MKAADFKKQFDDLILVHMYNPTVFRVTVLTIIGLIGFGGAGIPLLFQLEHLSEQATQATKRGTLLKNVFTVTSAVKTFQERLSPNTESIEWVRDLRELSKTHNIEVKDISPYSMPEKDPAALIKLTLQVTVVGNYMDLLKFIGDIETRKEKLTIYYIRLDPEEKKYRGIFKLGVLMQQPAQKKAAKSAEKATEKTPAETKAPEKQAPAQTAAVGTSTATATQPAPAAKKPKAAVPAKPAPKEVAPQPKQETQAPPKAAQPAPEAKPAPVSKGSKFIAVEEEESGKKQAAPEPTRPTPQPAEEQPQQKSESTATENKPAAAPAKKETKPANSGKFSILDEGN